MGREPAATHRTRCGGPGAIRHDLAAARASVTGSVTVRSERDDQDTTGHAPLVEAYLA